MKKSSSSPHKNNRPQTHEGSLLRQPTDNQKKSVRHIVGRTEGIQNAIKCIPIGKSQKKQIMMRMSPDSIRIENETKWNEKGFIPSFIHTDKILREASRRTYKILGISER